MASALPRVLLVEDDPGDVDLLKEALTDGRLRVSLDVVEDGLKAMQYLRREGPYANAQRPDMILLDLNLPKKDGREVLQEVKQDPALKSIPVVVFTTSDAEHDLTKTYGNGANCYVRKPVGFEAFKEVVHEIENFWLRIVKLPPRS